MVFPISQPLVPTRILWHGPEEPIALSRLCNHQSCRWLRHWEVTEPTQVTILFTRTLFMRVHSAFIRADFIPIHTNLIPVLITRKQSVVTSHERIGGIMNLSHRVSVFRSRDSMLSKGAVSILQGRIFAARWAAGQKKFSDQQGRVSGSQCQGRSAWHGVVS